MSALHDLILSNGGFAILDGAIATQLEKRGYKLSKGLWGCGIVLDHPEAVEQLHYDYFCAGADIGTSCSYQASFEAFEKIGITREQTSNLLIRSVELVKSARDRFYKEYKNGIHGKNRSKPLVAVSVSSYGASVIAETAQEFSGKYIENTNHETIFKFHKDRILCFLAADPDIILFETVPVLEEARIIDDILNQLKKEHYLPPTIISFSCKDENHTCYGDNISECAKFIEQSENVCGLSVNCTNPSYVVTLMEIARRYTTKILCCYPNSGEIYDVKTMKWTQSDHHLDNMSFFDLALILREKGVTIIGGCCRTGIDTVKQLSAALRK
jgi:homocysteine S-methyltransferase